METRGKLKSQKIIIDNEEEIEVMVRINDNENRGETEGEANVMSGQIVETEPELQTGKEQMKSVKRGEKDSTIDTQAMLLAFMEKFEDRMMKMESKFEDRMMKMESNFEDRMMKMESKFEGRMRKIESNIKEIGKMENRIIENVREVVTSITIDMHRRMDQRLESKKEESKIISVRSRRQIKTSTDTVPCDKSESFEAQIKH
jgi:hypothetical protein